MYMEIGREYVIPISTMMFYILRMQINGLHLAHMVGLRFIDHVHLVVDIATKD